MTTQAQNTVTRFLERAAHVRSIDPLDTDFSDLQAFAHAIQNTRVVMLGEATHGDGAAFLAKTRLVKYLHQYLGFDVLAFESGLFDCHKAWAFISSSEDARTAFRRGVFGVWSKSAQVAPLMDYLGQQARSPRPLELVGFDCQFSGSASGEFFRPELEAFLHDIGGPNLNDPNWHGFNATVQKLAEFVGGETTFFEDENPVFFERLAMLERELQTNERAKAQPDGAFWLRHVENLRVFAECTMVYGSEEHDTHTDNLRDAQMAHNLLWHLERLGNRKVIVWAANFHIARNLHEIEPERWVNGEFFPMGHHLYDALGPQCYVLRFIQFNGERGLYRTEASPVPTPEPGDLEDVLGQAGLEQAFIDLRHASELHVPIAARAFRSFQANADWSRVADGFFFIRTMTPSTKLSGI